MNRLADGLRRWASALLALVLLCALGAPALAADQPRVLRVAFPQVKGMSETAPDGTRHGLVVDYLNEIAKYTGWEYEYVETTGETMLSQFLDGEFELVGGHYFVAGLEEYYAYPDYNTGYSRSILMARRDDRSIRSYDLESLNGKTIGVYERAKENVRRLKEFLAINGLDCTLKYYTVEQISKTGNLYAYLESGEVDLLLGNASEAGGRFRVVAKYDSQPYYIVTNAGNQEVLDGLNMALEKIADSNPNFGREHYEANFPESMTADIQLSQEELAYIAQKGTVTVAVPGEWHPLFCLNTEDHHPGVVPDVLDLVGEYTGLAFDYVYADTYIGAVRLVQEGKADMLGFYLGGEDESARDGLALSAPYVSMSSTLVRNKASSYPADGLVCATVEGRTLPNGIQAASVKDYPTVTDALRAVNRGEVDFVYGISPRLEQDIQRYHFTNVVPVTLVSDSSDISFALPRPADPMLLTVINKAINSMSASERTAVLNTNMISIGTSQLSLSELVYANPVMFVAVLAAILLLIVAAILLVARARMHAAVIQSNLEKAEAESRAKGEFLSRMSHEIRTPMNAVVGLADLTGMMEGVPDPVRENLTKIRSSSRYLLSLINDILDMSRIESGMMSIASEPFSLDGMLADLQSMMSADAQRRGLHFTLEREIVHTTLTGDDIRLRQVLTNLLSNAFKFTPSGGTVLLRVQEEASTEADATFTFRVADSGVGIGPEDQERVFRSFEQLGPNISKSQGTGLGLAISRNIVSLMGGELKLRSQLGEGSEFSFTVTLPLGVLEERPEEPKSADGLRGARFLLAEDNDLNAEIAVQLLEIQGAQVVRTSNGREVVERFRASAPGEFQAVLMDIQMPEMDGLEATRAIRALDRPDAAEIPIVAMTANSFQEDADAAREAGMNGFVAKPIDVEYLYRILERFLKRPE